jgi:uridine kinase
MSYLVAVSAPVGGGKSSLVRGLAERLPDACAIHFDNYEALTDRPIDEIQRWMKDGADVDDFVVEHLPEHLARLKNGGAITDPTGTEIAAAKYIFFETPFARQHRTTGELIDLSIWIDTPLDVALARNLREFTRRPDMSADLAAWLGPYLDSYLDVVRDLLVMQSETVGAAADIKLDGLHGLDVNIVRAEREVLECLA